LTRKKDGWIRALISRLPKALKVAILRAVYLPVSTGGFMATVSLLRLFSVLRRPVVRGNNPPRRILVSYPYGNLGDLVLTLPMLEALHATWPSAMIDVAVRARVADLLTGIPFVGDVYRFPNRNSEIPELTSYLRILDTITIYRKQMVHRNYDLAISARWGEDPSYGSYLMYLTGAPRRYGYSASVTGRNVGADRVLTHVAAGGHHEQEALRILRLLNRVGLRSESPEDEDVVTAPIALLQDAAKLHRQELVKPPLDAIRGEHIVLAPGAMVPRKLWPAEEFMGTIEKLQQRNDATFVVIGSGDEAAGCQELVNRFPERAISLAGKTTLHQLIAVIANATLFIGNDSGPAHIAGALGIPTVVVNFFPSSCKLEHDSSPARFRPCGPRIAIVQPAEPLPPCNPCCSMDEPHCIQQVSVDQVLAAVDVLIPSGHGLPATVR
jgi:ADP-heptose:LPS heptosyltransferase